jgi:hypothetical protein
MSFLTHSGEGDLESWLTSFRLELPYAATIGLEMGILEEKLDLLKEDVVAISSDDAGRGSSVSLYNHGVWNCGTIEIVWLNQSS